MLTIHAFVVSSTAEIQRMVPDELDELFMVTHVPIRTRRRRLQAVAQTVGSMIAQGRTSSSLPVTPQISPKSTGVPKPRTAASASRH